MPDTKITALTALTAADPANDVLPIVDVSDTTMAASGTTKKISINNVLGCSGTATLASATITGDLTVDTNTLFVDAANNRVGIGTATPAAALAINLPEVSSTAGTSAIISNTTGGGNRIAALRLQNLTNQWNIRAYGSVTDDLRFGSGAAGSEVDYLSIGNTGIFTWSNVGGVAGTAMTLNSSGLGVGGSPTAKLSVVATGKGFVFGSTSAAGAYAAWQYNSADVGYVGNGTSIVAGAAATDFGLTSSAGGKLWLGSNNGASYAVLDSSGNVGIGVTPSAWNSAVPALQVKGVSGVYGAGSSEFGSVQNCFYNASAAWIYGTTAAAGRYAISSGTHQWHIAPSGTAGNAITFTQAMTLDASGNLLVAATSTSLTTGTGLKILQNSGVTTVGTVGSSSSDVDTTYRLYSSAASAYRFYVGYGGTVYATNTTISAISDARLKENVQDIDVGLGAILALKPRKFDWKAGKGKDIKGDRGFIAQEFEQVFPQLVDQWADEAPEGEAPYKSVRQDLIPVLVKAIQELAAEVNALKNA